ncbi:C-type lectin domain family 4 member M-like [Pelobates fuscus]|uniref:C-type lectin domain family 4 member M-like n=1 Tax=Pelobates fuscus TaxID=191477 RepID=UPI002FE4BDD6
MQNFYMASRNKMGKESSLDFDEDDGDDYENMSADKAPTVPVREKKGNQSSNLKFDLPLKREVLPPKVPQSVCTVSNKGLNFSSTAVNAAFRDDIGFQSNEKQKKGVNLVPVLLFLLTIMFFTLSILMGLLFMHYSTLSAELTELKLSGSRITDKVEQLKENVSKLKTTADNEHDNFNRNLTASNEALGKAQNKTNAAVQSVKGTVDKLCKTCPRGWRPFGSSCYFISSNILPWNEARDECYKINSELVIFSSKSEMDTLNKVFSGSTRYWIGLRRDTININVWKWLDGTEPTFTYWGVNEPNYAGNKEHCGETVSGPWNDRDCKDRLNFICKKVWIC